MRLVAARIDTRSTVTRGVGVHLTGAFPIASDDLRIATH
jgi:hypothetical protein